MGLESNAQIDFNAGNQLAPYMGLESIVFFYLSGFNDLYHVWDLINEKAMP